MKHTLTTKKHNIVNPDKWVGKYVRHMANWRDFQWLKTTDDNAKDDYFVDEWTGKLWRACDQGCYGNVFASKAEAVAAGYDECYYYSEDGLYQMWTATKAVLAA
jgi:hypothetical protein